MINGMKPLLTTDQVLMNVIIVVKQTLKVSLKNNVSPLAVVVVVAV